MNLKSILLGASIFTTVGLALINYNRDSKIVYEDSFYSQDSSLINVVYEEDLYYNMFNNMNRMTVTQGNTTYILKDCAVEKNLDYQNLKRGKMRDVLEEIVVETDYEREVYFNPFSYWRKENKIDDHTIQSKITKELFGLMNSFYNENREKNSKKLVKKYEKENALDFENIRKLTSPQLQ